MKVKVSKKIFYTNSNLDRIRVALTKSFQINWKSKMVTRDKKKEYDIIY